MLQAPAPWGPLAGLGCPSLGFPSSSSGWADSCSYVLLLTACGVAVWHQLLQCWVPQRGFSGQKMASRAGDRHRALYPPGRAFLSLPLCGRHPWSKQSQGEGTLRISKPLIKKNNWFKYQNSLASSLLWLHVSCQDVALPTANCVSLSHGANNCRHGRVGILHMPRRLFPLPRMARPTPLR